jgi:uncharacterized protein with von Willebrand factor type A (vWA) domain
MADIPAVGSKEGAPGAEAGAQETPARMAVAFSALLRRAGLAVPVGSVLVFAEGLTRLGLASRGAVYWAGRATLVRRPEDIDTYNRVFSVFWLGRDTVRVTVPTETVVVQVDDAEEPEGEQEGEALGARNTISVRYSPTETLRNKDFAVCTRAELDEMRRALSDLRLQASPRKTRRHRRSSRRWGRPDARRTLRQALRHGGEPVRRAYREPGARPRRIVLLCDVSGSMDPYARSLLRFLHVGVLGRTPVEAFALGTRLTRLTRELSRHDPDAALAAAAGAVPDWSGGTRLGEGLRVFNDRFGVRGMARGAVVVILSDGWDRGEPALLAQEMARLARVAHRIIWVNPLKAAPGYAPLARGMAAALPYVDRFLEGHSLASLEALAAAVAEEDGAEMRQPA